MRKLVFTLWLLCTVSGFLLASYGVLRESFANLTQTRGFGEGRFGEGPFGGGLTRVGEALITLGIKTGLLPSDRTLTLTDRKRNAALAIVGVILIGLSIIFDLIHRAMISRAGKSRTAPQ